MTRCGNRSSRTGFVCVREPGHEPPHRAAWMWGGDELAPTWTDLPKEGNPPLICVPGPRYHLDNLWLRGTALWVRLLRAIKLGINEFRAPSKADPDQPGTAPTGRHGRGTTLEIPHSTPSIPPSPQPHCITYIGCVYTQECWLQQRCIAEDETMG